MIKKEKVDDQKKAEDMKNMIMFGKLSPEMEANEGRIAAKANAQRIAREAQEAFEKMMRDDGVDVEPVKVPVFKKAPVAVAGRTQRAGPCRHQHRPCAGRNPRCRPL